MLKNSDVIKKIKIKLLKKKGIIKLIMLILFILFLSILSINNFNKSFKYFDILPSIKKYTKYPILKKIFKSKILYINDANITNEYIHFLRPIDEEKEKKYKIIGNESTIKFDDSFFIKREDQLDFQTFGKLCSEEKLLNYKRIHLTTTPYISVILPTHNKENTLMKSIRSIQNQSLKNIEIIIVDDCSTDNTNKYFKYLLKSDPRIRLFKHTKNLGLWRSRIDGFLYSNGEYVIQFDPGDIYEDNYVLEDAYNIIKKYNLDSVKMMVRFIYDYNNIANNKKAIIINDSFTQIAYQPDIEKYNYQYFRGNGWIWNRLIRKNIYAKSLFLLNNRVLNIYKNFWEDQWWNKIINQVSYNYLVLKRYSYLYFKDGKGEGDFKFETEIQRDKMIHEFIYFLYFDLNFLPKEDNKKSIINALRKFDDNNNKINLSFFKTKFYILDDLLDLLINDLFVSKEDKTFLYKLLNDSKKKQKNN